MHHRLRRPSLRVRTGLTCRRSRRGRSRRRHPMPPLRPRQLLGANRLVRAGPQDLHVDRGGARRCYPHRPPERVPSGKGDRGGVAVPCEAPSTIGTFLRTLTFGIVRQLDAVATRLLANVPLGVTVNITHHRGRLTPRRSSSSSWSRRVARSSQVIVRSTIVIRTVRLRRRSIALTLTSVSDDIVRCRPRRASSLPLGVLRRRRACHAGMVADDVRPRSAWYAPSTVLRDSQE